MQRTVAAFAVSVAQRVAQGGHTKSLPKHFADLKAFCAAQFIFLHSRRIMAAMYTDEHPANVPESKQRVIHEPGTSAISKNIPLSEAGRRRGGCSKGNVLSLNTVLWIWQLSGTSYRSVIAEGIVTVPLRRLREALMLSSGRVAACISASSAFSSSSP
eukprot:s1088_g2.t1